MSLTVRLVITRTFAAILAALALSLATLSIPTTSQAFTPARTSAALMDMDCGDFDNQAAAQRYFIRIGGPNSDPDALDADGDGIACESNPCPCSTATDDGGGDNGGPNGDGSTRPPLKVDRAVVVKVIDGDTVDVRLTKTKRKVRVRVIGIDTPEVYGGRECWGPQASRSAKQILPRGTRVTITSDRSQDLKDRYGRLLRYIKKNSNKADFGKVQVRRGNARVYVYGDKPFDRTRSYKTSQTKAKRADRGLWGKCR